MGDGDTDKTGIISTRRRGIDSGEGSACAFEPASPIEVPRVTPAAQEAETTKDKTEAKGREGETEWGDREEGSNLPLAVLVDEIEGRANSP